MFTFSVFPGIFVSVSLKERMVTDVQIMRAVPLCVRMERGIEDIGLR